MTLRVEGVSYRYAGSSTRALDGLDLEVTPGEILGIVGANEAGKSTLVLVASGLAPRTIGGRLEGRVLVDDLDTTTAPQHELAVRCGTLFQSPLSQLSGTTRTVWEEVAFGPRNLGLPLAEVIERVASALDLLRLDALADREPGRLSGGQAQLVALASVLAMRPAYLLLDEPTSELDPQGSRLVGETFVGIARSGVGLVVIEHKSWLLEGVAERVGILDAGRLVALGSAGEVLADPGLRNLGVEPPPSVRLRAAAKAAGVTWPLPSGATV
jgi:energy-coupling factor transport system ATP-binding protein